MIEFKKGLAFGICLGLILWVALSFPFSAWAEADVKNADRNGITRQFDHVVIKGSDLKENLKKPIGWIRLHALQDGTMAPIPFQIDEITDDEDWVLPHKYSRLQQFQHSSGAKGVNPTGIY